MIPVPRGLVVLVGPPTSGKTSFVRALIERRQLDAGAVVSSDEIRAEFFGTPAAPTESEAADARIFEERDRGDLTAEDVHAYTVIMARDGSTDQLRSEGATAVHDVPGRSQGASPTEAAARFFFA